MSKTTRPPRSKRRPAGPARDDLRELLDLTARWYYWEQDTRFRFTRLSGAIFKHAGIDPAQYLGKTRWQLGMVPAGDGGSWEKHKALLAARRPFTDFVFRYTLPNGSQAYVSTSGRPMFDARGRFRGYRGVSKDITRRVQVERRRTIEHGVSRILTEATAPAEAIARIVRTLCDALEYAGGAYWELDERERVLRFAHGAGIEAELEPFLAAMRGLTPLKLQADPALRRVCTADEAVWLPQLPRVEHCARAAPAAAGVRALLAFPVKAGGRVLGVLELYGRDAGAPDDELRAGMEYAGNSIGMFLDRRRTEAQLRRFRAAMDTSLDAIYLIDPETMKFVDFNDAACRRTGYTREELLRLGPQDIVLTPAEELRDVYARVIAAGPLGLKTEMTGRARDGRRAVVEVQHRVLESGDRPLIVSISRDITERRQAEQANSRLAALYATLGATNEAILRAESADDLYRRVCDAAVHGGKFRTAAVLLPDFATGRLQPVAVSGVEQPVYEARISIDASVPEGRGLAGTAYRTGRPAVSRDLLNDESTRPWHALARSAGIVAAAALPLRRREQVVGVLFFGAADKHAFDEELLRLLERVAENVAFALENLDREAERRAAEQAVRASEEKYRAILENMSEGYFEVDLEGNYTAFNDAMCRIHRATPEQLAGRNYREYAADEETAKQVYAIYNEIYRTGKPAQLTEWPFVRQDGTRGFWESSAQLVRDASGRPVGFRGIVRDVTERKHAEEALRASEEKYRTILESMYDGYFEVDLDGTYTFVNEALCRNHGHAREELVGMNYREYLDEATVRHVTEIYREVLRTGRPAHLPELPYKRKDGSPAVFESSVQLMRDDKGQPIGFRGVTRDVTKRRQAEEALRASEEKYRGILEGMEDGYYEVDLKGNYVFFNKALCRMLGRTESELYGVTYRDYMEPAVAERAYATFNAVYRTGQAARGYDWEVIRQDGTRLLVEGSVQLVRDPEGKPVGFRGVMRDVTERRQMEHALRESEARFRSLTDLSSDWFWEQDREFRFTKFEGKKIAGGPIDFRTTVLGRCPWELPGIVKELADWDWLRARHERHESFRDFEYAYRDRKGTLYFVAVNGEPVFDEHGAFAGFRGTSRDITERKREQRLLALEHAVTRVLAEAKSTRRTLREIVRIICESEGWESGGYWVFDAEQGTMRLETGWSASPNPDTVAHYQALAGKALPADGMLHAVWSSGEARWIADMNRAAPWRNAVRHASEQGALAFPLRSDARTLGVLSFSSREIREPDARLLRTFGVIGDQVGQFLQRRQAERVLRESEARFRALTELSSDWYWEQDAEFRFTRVESRREDVASARDYLLGRRPWETGYVPEHTGDWDAHRAELQARKSYRDLVIVRSMPDGTRRYLSVSGEPFFDANDRFLGYRGVSREVTAQKRAEERIQYLATHDELTGLPNRVMFAQLLHHAAESARRYQRGLAVLFVDLDRFKVINDTLGHDAGDVLLQEIGARLRQALRASDVIARLGGDEFVVLVQEVADPNQVAIIARKILATVVQPIMLAGQECRVTASIGISLFPTDAEDEQALMKNADIAMYQAKEEGKNNFQFYSKETRTQSLERLMLETSLRRALDSGELEVHYQPKIDLRTLTITGAEALLRWHSRGLGSVSPAQFIPVAEETGLIVPIGKWVLQSACAQNVAWQRQGLPPIRVAVNLSARQLSDENLLDDIASILRETGMAPELLELEITEGTMIHNPARTMKLLGAIRALGVRLAIDDFGTGYSSLGQLKNFPIDTLKVDRSFVRDIPNDAEDSAITKAIIAMGKSLDLTVVAEGVETRAQADFLRRHGCDEMQGYYFSRPVPANQLAELLRTSAEAPHARRAEAQ